MHNWLATPNSLCLVDATTFLDTVFLCASQRSTTLFFPLLISTTRFSPPIYRCRFGEDAGRVNTEAYRSLGS